MTFARTILSFDLGQALGSALCGRHDHTSSNDAWLMLLDDAVKISEYDPDVVAVAQEVRTAVGDLVSPATIYLYAEWTRQNVTSEDAKALLDGISFAALWPARARETDISGPSRPGPASP